MDEIFGLRIKEKIKLLVLIFAIKLFARTREGYLPSSFLRYVDIRELIKSFHNISTTDESSQRKSSIVHSPIDWSKQRVRNISRFIPSIVEEEEEDEEDEEEREYFC